MIISRTPFRVSFFGGGTDYPAWFHEHGGAVLATTINKYCYLTCRYLPPFFEHRYRVVYSRVENCQEIGEITHPAVREVLKFLGVERGLEIHHDGDLPARSGMGSSSSFTVGLLHALHALHGRMPNDRQLATESIKVEQGLLKETVGCQDQILAAYGGFNHITFHRDGDFTVRPLTLPADRVKELESHIMLFYTGIKRTASDIAETYVRDIAANESSLSALGALVDEGMSLINRGEDITRFGELLHEAWRLKRSLSNRVSNSELDEIYAQAMSAGAVGGKLTGAGGGGFLLLFVPPSRRKNVLESLNKLVHVPLEFSRGGSQIIFYDPGEDFSATEVSRDMNVTTAFRELDAG
jgi:D-glycero-alpha-D-manno-heptose-7-phosphate kinase